MSNLERMKELAESDRDLMRVKYEVLGIKRRIECNHCGAYSDVNPYDQGDLCRVCDQGYAQIAKASKNYTDKDWRRRMVERAIDRCDRIRWGLE